MECRALLYGEGHPMKTVIQMLEVEEARTLPILEIYFR